MQNGNLGSHGKESGNSVRTRSMPLRERRFSAARSIRETKATLTWNRGGRSRAFFRAHVDGDGARSTIRWKRSESPREATPMSYTAYLYNIKAKTGHGPEYYQALARKKGLAKHGELSNQSAGSAMVTRMRSFCTYGASNWPRERWPMTPTKRVPGTTGPDDPGKPEGRRCDTRARFGSDAAHACSSLVPKREGWQSRTVQGVNR
jgi:hypothetical protein